METNETAEAMKQIAEIHKVIEGGNKAVFSGPRMMAIGALVVLIPVIEWATGSLTFGVNALRGSVPVVIIVHAVFYWALFTLALKFLSAGKADTATFHPLINKAFRVKRPFMFALFGMIFALASSGHARLIQPVVLILLGFLFSVFGSFSIPVMSYIAWSYLAAGVLLTYLTQFDIPYLTLGFALFNGVSLVVLGYCLRKEQESA